MTEHNYRFRRFWYEMKYLGRPRWDTGISPPELIDTLNKIPSGRALDLGCGTGTNLLTLADAGWDVTGVDYSMLSVWRARKKLHLAGYRGKVIRGDVANDLGLGMDYDLILDIGCYHNLTGGERESYQKLLSRRLKAGGVFLLYAHWRMMPESLHGIDEGDITALDGRMKRTWRSDGVEARKDGTVGFHSVWLRYEGLEKTKV